MKGKYLLSHLLLLVVHFGIFSLIWYLSDFKVAVCFAFADISAELDMQRKIAKETPK